MWHAVRMRWRAAFPADAERSAERSPCGGRLAVAAAAVAALAAAASAQHWAFTPPRAAPPATVGDPGWARDPLDGHVQQALAAVGRRPSAPAAPLVQLRRVHLALTGLPPTAAEVAAYVADARPDAYERRVDELLARHATAEHLATAWLDLARFADTFGYQADFECRTWPWRDWLLQALHDDRPWPRFIDELVAGDLLPDADQQTRTATAFWRLHRMTNEGGSIEAEWRHEAIADRVDTLGAAFLGLTVGCARCHDHKSDPIAQRDYYALGTFFAIDECGLYPYATGGAAQPTQRLFTSEQAANVATLQAAAAAARSALATAQARALADAAASAPAMDMVDAGPLPRAVGADLMASGLAAAVRAPARWSLAGVAAMAASGAPRAAVAPTPTPTPRAPIAAFAFGGTSGASARDERSDRAVGVPAAMAPIDGLTPGAAALRCDGDATIGVDGLPGFGRAAPRTVRLRLSVDRVHERAVVLHTSHFTEDADAQGYQLLLRDGRLCWEVVHHWPGSAAAVATSAQLPLDRWLDVCCTYDGSSRAAGLCVYVDGERAATTVVRDHLHGPAVVRRLVLGGRDRDKGFVGGGLARFELYDLALTAAEVAVLAGSTPRRDDLLAHHAELAPAVVAARAAARAADEALHAAVEQAPELMVMAPHGHPKPRYVLRRGAYDQPDRSQPVGADVPAAVLPWDPSWPRDRRGLARWLCDARNPLPARVVVDRLWAQCFGRGLVRTPDNFGLLGERPTQQALLDALAVDFQRHGSHKRILRRIVTSATFRQSSAATPAQRDADPDNDLLGRGPSFRLSAEALRDQALLAAGLLQPRFGGPSVKPYQPPGLWRDAGIGWGGGDYQPDQGPDAHRRSLYTYRKRTAPPPNLMTLDGASREVCVVRRQGTDTPLQALVLLGDPVFTECADALAAQQLARAGAHDDDRLAAIFAALCTRPPTAGELAALRGVLTATADAKVGLAAAASAVMASDAAVVLR